jgi:hypothetical protein
MVGRPSPCHSIWRAQEDLNLPNEAVLVGYDRSQFAANIACMCHSMLTPLEARLP